MIDLERQDDVFILRMNDGENRFNPKSIAAWNTALDEVESAQGPHALVTTGTQKFYSNGLDLDWMTGDGRDQAEEFLASVHALLARMLCFPAITIAAINGHAFAGGGMLALAHDYRVMREDRGYFCLPEVDLGMPLTAGMTALIKSKLPTATHHEAIVTGRRYGGADAVSERIVHRAVPESEILATALEIVRPLSQKDPATLRVLKQGLYPQTLEKLTSGPFIPTR